MKILITGGEGQLGSSLTSNYPKNLEIYSYSKNELDITKLNNLKEIINNINPDIIVNTAAFTKVDLAETKYEEAYNINSIGPKNLSTIIKDFDIFLIHISTECVFDGRKEGYYTELDQTNPKTVYGKTKLIGEDEIIKSLKKYMIFRVSWLYGYGVNNFVYKIIDNIMKKNKLTVVNDQFGRPTSVFDFSTLIWKAIKKISTNNYKPGIYNYSDGGIVVSRYDMARYIIKNFKKTNFSINNLHSTSSLDMNLPAERLNNSLLSLSKTRKEFNFKETDWKNSLLKVIKSIENAY